MTLRAPYLDDGDVRLYVGDCIEVMQEMDADSVDAVVCDPPYGLEFMGKDWDRFSPVDLDRGGRWTADKRSEPGTTDNSDKRTPHGRTGVAFGANRTYTSACEGCGKRDAFRNEHGCAEGWRRVPVDDGPPPQMVAFAAWCETWAREALRVLKPGGHLLAFGGTRTFHRLTCGIEDAGFEVRDCLSWLYGSGFPKSLDVSKAIDKAAGAEREVVRVPLAEVRNPKSINGGHGIDGGDRPWMQEARARGYHEKAGDSPATDAAREWQGWGTALKPAWEPCVMARKPLVGTVAQNVQQHGTGALNIDGCRIPHGDDVNMDAVQRQQRAEGAVQFGAAGLIGSEIATYKPGGRWPANVALDEEAAAMLDAQSGERGGGFGVRGAWPTDGRNAYALAGNGEVVGYGDTGGASRFFYTAKASRADRNAGGMAENTHPTVKPTDLMRWLVRMVTPPGGIVLDPFAGSGSTLVAARAEGVRAVGIEREDEYARIIADRLAQLSLFSEGMGE
jgi:DNA modification methylase